MLVLVLITEGINHAVRRTYSVLMNFPVSLSTTSDFCMCGLAYKMCTELRKQAAEWWLLLCKSRSCCYSCSCAAAAAMWQTRTSSIKWSASSSVTKLWYLHCIGLKSLP